ncbi:MAG: transporter substrate-binding domain-containing protein [Gemmatimonadetes bacterium]|nr:transporter substrate-binding domain-containing protein [Gemmatimonadota bacterium]
MRYTLRAGAAAAALLSAVAAAQAQTSEELIFCAGVDNLPMSEAAGPSGFEVDLARALAERLGRTARFEWLDPHHDFTEKAVLDGRCDAALGAIVEPGGMAGAQPITGVTLTEPYYSAGYLLIHRPGVRPVRTLEALRGTRIALEGESLVTYTLRQQGHQVYVLRDYQGVVDAVADGRAEYGYLWGPLSASLTHNRSDVVLAEGFRPAELWSFAMAVRGSETELRQALDRAIREMVEGGSLDAIFSRYRVPYVAPASRPANGS